MGAAKGMPAAEQDEHMSDRRIARLVEMIEEADAIVVGGASGMSAAGGDSWYDKNPTFLKYYGDLYERLGESSAGIFPMLYFPFKEEGQRVLSLARTMQMVDESEVPQQYWDLKELLEGKEHFVLTTNQDQLFRRVFGDEKTAFIQGDWGWLQCGLPCHDGLYSNRDFVERAIRGACDCEVPERDFPRCPRCGRTMTVWARGPEFLEGAMYAEQYRKLNAFLEDHMNKKVLFLELGVGSMTPMFIKQPFWNYTYQWPGGATYVPITLGHAVVPEEISARSLPFDAEIDKVLHRAAELKREEEFATQGDAFKQEVPIDRADAIGRGV